MLLNLTQNEKYMSVIPLMEDELILFDLTEEEFGNQIVAIEN